MSVREQLGKKEDALYLMDGTAFLYRAFFTGRNMQRSDGFPTNVLVGVTRLLLRILREEKPRYFLFVRDGHGKTFRHKLFADYKANRSATPEDLVRQIEPVSRVVAALGLKEEVTNGFEADDCMATLAARFSSQRPVIIISGDKDLKQCLAPNVFIWNLSSKDEPLTSEDDFRKEYGISPEIWPDVQALVGDTADNIPGVPGIGPKTALEIFHRCSSLEDIRAHLQKVPVKLQGKLHLHMDEMFTWRELTRLSKDYPKAFSLDDLRVGPMQGAELDALSREFELVVLRREIAFMLGEANGKGPKSTSFASKGPAEIAPANKNAYTANDLLPGAKTVALIGDPRTEEGLHIAIEGEEPPCEYRWQGSLENLCSWLKDVEQIVVADMRVLMRADFPLSDFVRVYSELFFDLSLAAYLLRPDEGEYGLAHLEAHLALPFRDGVRGRAGVALALAKSLLTRLQQADLMTLYSELERPLIPVLFAMEERGIAIDADAFRLFLQDVEKDLSGLTEKIFTLCGKRFNLRSAQQLGEVLFTDLHLTPPSKTKGGQSATNQQTLEKLVGEHPVITPILQFRKLEKVRSTYLEPLPRLVDQRGRLHTTFEQKGTATGRLSSRDPNLQNIPARGALGKRMRGCFVAEAGNVLLSSDYSQIELRMLAHISGDPVMLETFRQGVDIHTRTAALIYGIPEELVSKEQRSSAKTINFGLIYGMGSAKLAQELHISIAKAKEFIANYFAGLSALKDFYRDVVEEAKEKGYVTTIAGRRRFLPDLCSANTYLSAQASRQAINTVIQGSAADIIKMAMLAVANDARLAELGARLLLQVHDELVLEVPAMHAEEVGALVSASMEGVKPLGQTLSLPLVAEWGYGRSWGEAH